MHSFYAHLISYFFFHPTKSLQLIGAVGKNESKIALNFHHEALVKTLTGKTQYQRELYCLTALYEMSNMLAYKLLCITRMLLIGISTNWQLLRINF